MINTAAIDNTTTAHINDHHSQLEPIAAQELTLDGVATQEGNVLFMTTNHAERLDEALIRAGRIDERVELGTCDEDQLRRLYLKFQPDEAAARAYATENVGKALSPAQVQGDLMRRFGAVKN